MRLSTRSLSLAAVAALALLGSSVISALPNPIRRHQPSVNVVRFDNHKVVRIQVDTKEQLDVLTAHERALKLDYFSHHKVVGGHMDVRIAPEHFQDFQDLNLNYKIKIDNLQAVLDKEEEDNRVYQQRWETLKKEYNGKTDGGNVFATADWFAGYHSYADHMTWLSTQLKSYPNIATSFSAGTTYQGRSQAGIKIGSGPNNVVLHGLQHAREWISGAVVEYIIDQLLQGADTRVAAYLTKYTFHIIPIMNPDGFLVTQSSNRMHRKNVQVNGGCLGTDSEYTRI